MRLLFLESRQRFVSTDPHALRVTLNSLQSQEYEQEVRFQKLRANMGYPGALIDRIESGEITDKELKIPGVADAFATRGRIEKCLLDIRKVKQALKMTETTQ